MALTIAIITPEVCLPPREADAVVLPACDGQVGILPRHADFVCLLGAGVLILKSDDGSSARIAVQGGIARVANDEIRVLAEHVRPAEEVDVAGCQQELDDLLAMKPASHAEEAKVERRVSWMRAQLQSVKPPDAPCFIR